MQNDTASMSSLSNSNFEAMISEWSHNDAIRAIMTRRSVRNFASQLLLDGHLEKSINSGQAASTSSSCAA